MSGTTEQNPAVGYFTLDKRKSLRAYAPSGDQIWWAAVWLAPAAFIAIQWFDTSLRPLAVFPILMCIGAWKTSQGIIFRNVQASLEDWRLGKRGDVIYDGTATKKQPLGLKIMSFEMPVDVTEVKSLVGDDLDAETLNEIIGNKVTQSTNLATIYSRRERTDTGFISGSGLQGLNGNPEDVFAARKGVAEGISRAVSLYEKKPSACLIYSRRPTNLIPQLLWDQGNLDQTVQQAAQLKLKNVGVDDRGIPKLDVDSFFAGTVEERQKAALQLERARAAVDDEEVTQLIAVSYKRPRFVGVKRGQTLDGRLRPRQLQRMPIKRLLDEFARESTNAGVTDVSILDYLDVNKLIATGCKIKEIDNWQQELYEWAADVDASPDLPIPTPWPNLITSHRTPGAKICTKMGDTYFLVKKVARYTKDRFPAEALLSLFEASDAAFQPSKYVGLTLSLCGDFIDVERENSILTRRRAIAKGLEKNRDRGDEIITQSDVEKREALANKQDALHFGGVNAMVYNAYVTVAASRMEMLDDASDALDGLGRTAGVKFNHFDKKLRHARSLMTALYGVNMVNR